MDSARFDSLTRSLTRAGSRRRAMAAAIGGALAVLALADPEHAVAGNSGKCKPKCADCETCDKGPCHRTQHGKVCKKGKCKPKPNDIPCSGSGKCLNGICNAQPTCKKYLDACDSGNPQFCCSGICNAFNPFTPTCATGAAGTNCLAPTDCTSGSCVGYRCA